MQRSDAPARNVPGFWLGDPSSGWRWPFDATFTAWKIWFLTLPVAFVLLWLIVPVIAFITLATWAVARLARRGAPPIFVRGRNLTPGLAGGSVALLAVGLTTNPLAWLVPLPWYLAAPATPLLALLFTRTVTPWVKTNTPMSYWLRLFPRVAAGPRPSRPPRTLGTSSPDCGGDEWHPIMLHALTIDPSEISMPLATPRVEPVEYDQWLPHDVDRAAATVAWLQSKGYTVQVAEDRALYVNLGTASVLTVRPANYVVLTGQVRGGITSLHPEVFARGYIIEDEA